MCTKLIPAPEHSNELSPVSQNKQQLLCSQSSATVPPARAIQVGKRSLSVKSSNCAAVVNICSTPLIFQPAIHHRALWRKAFARHRDISAYLGWELWDARGHWRRGLAELAWPAPWRQLIQCKVLHFDRELVGCGRAIPAATSCGGRMSAWAKEWMSGS